MTTRTLGPINDERNSAFASSTSTNMQEARSINSETPTVSRQEIDAIRSGGGNAAKSLVDAVGNDHHQVAHINFQTSVNANQSKTHTGSSIETGFEKDPRFAAAQEELRRVTTEFKKQNTALKASLKDATARLEDYDDKGVSGSASTIFGANDAVLKMREASLALADEQSKNQKKMLVELREKRKLYDEMIKAETEGRALQTSGDLDKAQDAFNRAQYAFQKFGAISGPGVIHSSETYARLQRAAVEANDRAISNITTAETVTKTTQTVAKAAVVTGATIATAGSAGLVYAAVAGTGYGAALSATANTVEGVGHYALGNKSGAEAIKDAAWSTVEDTKNAAINAAATASGIKAAQLVRGGAATVSFGRAVAAGAAAGATTATVGTGVAMGAERLWAEHTFAKSVEGKDLTPQQREVEKANYLTERGLTGSQMLKTGAVNVAIGVVAGGVGGGSQHVTTKIAQVSEKAISKTLQTIGVRATEAGVNTGLGLGAAYLLNGGVDLNSAVQIVGNAAISDGIGRSAAKPIKSTAPVATETKVAPVVAKPETQHIATTEQPSSTITVNLGQTSSSKLSVQASTANSAPSTGNTSAGTTLVSAGNVAETSVTLNVGNQSHTSTGTQASPAAKVTPAKTLPGTESQPTPSSIEQVKAPELSPKQVELNNKALDISDHIASKEKWIEFNNKLVAEGKITAEQAAPVVKEAKDSIADLKRQQLNVQKDLEIEVLTRQNDALSQQASAERERTVRLKAEQATAEKEKIYSEHLQANAEAARESQATLKPTQDRVVSEAKRNIASHEKQLEDQLILNRERKAREEQLVSKGTERLLNEPTAPPAQKTSPSSSSAPRSPEEGGGTREVLVAKVVTEHQLQKTADGRTIAVPKQKTTYVAVAEESPIQAKQRAQLEKLLKSTEKLSKEQEVTTYKELEAHNPKVADEIFIHRKAKNGGFVTKEDVVEICTKAKIDVPEAVQPKPVIKAPVAEPETQITSRISAFEENLSDPDGIWSPGRDHGSGVAVSTRTTPRVTTRPVVEEPMTQTATQTQTRVATRPQARVAPEAEAQAAARTSVRVAPESEVISQTNTRYNLQPKPINGGPGKPPGKAKNPEQRRSDEEGGGDPYHSEFLAKKKRQEEESANARRKQDDHLTKEEHAIKEDWVDGKDGSIGHYERRGG